MKTFHRRFDVRAQGRWLRQLGCVLAVWPALSWADAPAGSGYQFSEIELELRSHAYSDPLRLRDFGVDDWEKRLVPRPGKNLIIVDQQVALSAYDPQRQFRFSVLSRALASAVLSESTGRLVQEVSGSQSRGGDWSASVDLRLRGLLGEGVGAEQTWQARPGWQLMLGGQVLNLRRMAAGSLQGTAAFQAANATASQQYDFDLTSQRIDSRLDFPFRVANDDRGLGLLLHSQVEWRADAWRVTARLDDWGWMTWSQLPTQTLRFNSNVNQRAADGSISYQPLVQGRNTQPEAKLRTPWHGGLELAWSPTPQAWVSLPWRYQPGYGWLPALRWQDARLPVKLVAEWQVHQQVLVLGAEWRGWSARFDLGPGQQAGRSRVWQLGYRYMF